MTHPAPSDRARRAAARIARIMAGNGSDLPDDIAGGARHWLVDELATFERETPGFAAGVEADYRCDHCGRLRSNAERAGSTHCAAPHIVQMHAFTGKHPADALTPPPPASEGLDAEGLYKIVCEAMTDPGRYCDFAADKGMQDWCARAVVLAIRPALEAERAKWEGQVADWLATEAAMTKGLTAWFWIKEGRFGLWFFRVKAMGRLLDRLAAAIRSGAYRQEQDNG